MKRILTEKKNSTEWREGTDEFIEYFRISDTLLPDTDPILVELEWEIDHAAQPFHGWMVLSVEDENGNSACYKRIPLHWLRYSWNQSGKQKYHLITGEMPSKIKNMVVYLWNQNKEFVKIKMNHLRFYRLRP